MAHYKAGEYGTLVTDKHGYVVRFEPSEGTDPATFESEISHGEHIQAVRGHWRRMDFDKISDENGPDHADPNPNFAPEVSEEHIEAANTLSAKLAAARERNAERAVDGPSPSVEQNDDGNEAIDKASPLAYGTISKADEEQQIVYGWAYVTHDKDGKVVVDKSGEFVDDISEIEKTAVRFMLESRKGDVNHTNIKTTDIVESMVFTPEKMEKMGISKGVLPSGWWIGVKCSDVVWADYKAGKYTAFSVHGKGVKKAV